MVIINSSMYPIYDLVKKKLQIKLLAPAVHVHYFRTIVHVRYFRNIVRAHYFRTIVRVYYFRNIVLCATVIGQHITTHVLSDVPWVLTAPPAQRIH